MQDKVCKLFTPKNLQAAAVKSGFYQRSSKLLPFTFFDILLQGASVNGPFSLAQYCGDAALNHSVSITKQALDDRFDDTAVAFVKEILDEVMANQIDLSLDPQFLERFRSVRIKDSTRFDLPERLKESFPGFGGKITSEAGAAIQYEFDLKTRRLVDLDITSALKNDIQDAQEKVASIEEGELIIRDLGYFSSRAILAVIERKGFFLSRLRAKMDVLDENQQEVSFKKMYDRMVKCRSLQHHMQATIGRAERVPVRLLVEIVPEKVYKERIRRREKENRKKGYSMSEEFRSRARFNLMVTNAPEEDLPVENIYKLYRTRWQVELIFKVWKSVMGMDKIHPMKYSRLMCLLYAKLILFLVNSQVAGLIARTLYAREKKLLSMDKCLKTLQLYFGRTREVLVAERFCLTDYIQAMYRLLSKNHWLEKRKEGVGFAELFSLFSCMSG
jgi:hypothetical protein